jgi:hypothetical protein
MAESHVAIAQGNALCKQTPPHPKGLKARKRLKKFCPFGQLFGDFAAPHTTRQQSVIKPVRFFKPNRFNSGGYEKTFQISKIWNV